VGGGGLLQQSRRKSGRREVEEGKRKLQGREGGREERMEGHALIERPPR